LSSESQDRHEHEIEEEKNEEKDNEKTDTIDSETRRRVIFFFSNVGRARVLDWQSGQRGESGKR